MECVVNGLRGGLCTFIFSLVWMFADFSLVVGGFYYCWSPMDQLLNHSSCFSFNISFVEYCQVLVFCIGCWMQLLVLGCRLSMVASFGAHIVCLWWVQCSKLWVWIGLLNGH